MSVKKSIIETATSRKGTMLPLLRGMFICPEVIKTSGGELLERSMIDLPGHPLLNTTAARIHEMFKNGSYTHASAELINDPVAF